MEWWLWCIFGCVLLMLELVVPGGFFFLFFGVGALVTGVVVSFGVVPADWAQWLLFSGCSVLLLVLLRAKARMLLERNAAPERDLNGMTGMVGNSMVEIQPGQVGQVELRGAQWTARNVGGNSLQVGQRCVVQGVDGLVLSVKAE